jgi:hypothetical protein
MGYTVRRIADVNTFWAIHHFTCFVWAHWLAVWSLKLENKNKF